MTATVLIVDDFEANIKLIEGKLVSEYYTVLSVSSGSEALEALEKHKIDIVLLDVMMPEMDGFETCKQIKANPETTHIPVVMITALSEINDRVKGLEAGADEFLTKPVDEISLLARVKSLTRMKTVIDELKLRNNTLLELGGEIIEPKDNFKDSKFLLIDDDVVQAKNITANIAPISTHVRTISNPNEINSIEPSFIPDIVIISCQLDDHDPLRVVATLRSKPLLKNTIFMLLAEEETMPKVIKGLELGVNDYFMYPVDESELQARIKTQLRRKEYQDNLFTELEESVDLSTKDALTGLFNRRYFDIHIKQMFEKAKESKKPMCMMMLDIDYFKKVNDTHGHPAGDAILKQFSKILKESFRVTDLISRYGGEEFTVLLGNTEIDNCTKIANKLKDIIEKTSFIIPENDEPIKKTTSIGVAKLKLNESVDNFIKRVDTALYKAKKSGRNKVVVG